MSLNRGVTIEDYWRNVELLELAACDPREARIVAYNWLEEACGRRGLVVPLDALEAASDAAIELQEENYE